MSTAAFLENHDQAWFNILMTDQSLVKNAIATAFVTDGVPILFYARAGLTWAGPTRTIMSRTSLLSGATDPRTAPRPMPAEAQLRM